MANWQWQGVTGVNVPRWRWERLESSFSEPATPHWQWSKVEASGTAPATPNWQWIRLQANAVESNSLPTANAGPNQANIEPGTVVTLNGAGSDPDGTIAVYEWSQTAGVAVTLSSTSVANPTFVAPGSMDGTTLTFSLVVIDNDDAASPADLVDVTVLQSTEFVRVDGAWVPRRLSKRSAGAWV